MAFIVGHECQNELNTKLNNCVLNEITCNYLSLNSFNLTNLMMY